MRWRDTEGRRHARMKKTRMPLLSSHQVLTFAPCSPSCRRSSASTCSRSARSSAVSFRMTRATLSRARRIRAPRADVREGPERPSGHTI